MSGPGGEHIDLWVIDLDQWAASSLDPTLLTERDREQARRLRSPGGGGRLLARRSATRAVLGRSLGAEPAGLAISRRCPTCGADDHGAPFLEGRPEQFSVSSCGGVAVVAVSGSAVGVDVETVSTERTAPLPRAAMVNGEQRALDALPEEDHGPAFLRLWTIKEAALKAGGRSLADDPATIDATQLLTADAGVVDDGSHRWHVRLLDVDHPVGGPVILALADEHGLPVVRRS